MIKRCTVVALAVAVVTIVGMPSPAVAQVIPEPGNGQIQRAEESIAGQYIVKLREPPTAVDLDAKVDALADEYSGRVLHTFESVNAFAARLTEDEALALSTDPSVERVEEDGLVHATVTQTPTPSWGLDRIDQAVRPLDNAYTYDADGTGVIAYVIDSGILVSHVDFGGRATVGIDFVGDGRNGIDCSGHGTHVAGTLGGTAYGVAKNVSLVAVRVLDCNGEGFISNVIAAIDWVTDHQPPGTSALANMSLGGNFSSTTLDDAVEASIASGITYVVAAGNSNTDACSFSPARAPNALTVGATTSSDSRSSFSNWGPCLDLFAPGSEITSAGISGPSNAKVLSGTSMAAPHVAGVVARYLQLNPNAAPDAVAAAVSGAACHAVTDPGPGSNDLLVFAGLGTVIPPGLPASCGAEYIAVTPARILDTRGGGPGVTCNPAGGAVGSGSVRDVKVTGCVGVPPTEVAAVVMNVTVDVPTTSSFLTVWPKGAPQPAVSNLNFLPGQTVPNLVTVKVGTNGMVSVYNFSGSVHVIADVVGWYVAPGGAIGSRFHPLTPARLLDTRATAPIGTNASISLPVTNVGGVPGPPVANVTAVVINVVATQPSATSFLTVFPGDLAIPPTVSNLNFVTAQTVANLVIVKVPTSGPSAGTIKLYNKHGSTHAIVDVVGWFDDDHSTLAGLFHSLAPARVLDTRFTSPIGPNTNRLFAMSGKGGVPTGGVSAVILNTTVAQPTASGYLTVYPANLSPHPGSSNLNFESEQVVPNLVITGVSAGSLRYYNFAGFTHVIFDVAGYFTSS